MVLRRVAYCTAPIAGGGGGSVPPSPWGSQAEGLGGRGLDVPAVQERDQQEVQQPEGHTEHARHDGGGLPLVQRPPGQASGAPRRAHFGGAQGPRFHSSRFE